MSSGSLTFPQTLKFEIKSGKPIAVMTISYTAQPKEQTMLLQFCGKNFPRKGIENTQIYFQMFGMGENEKRNLLHTSDSQLYSSKILWKPFKLPKNIVINPQNRNFEVLCYSRDDHTRCSIIGQLIITSDMLLKNAEERKIFHYNGTKCATSLCQLPFIGMLAIKMDTNNFSLRIGLESNKKANGIIEVVKCNEITMYSFLDYITNGQPIAGTSRGILHVGYRGEELEVPWRISGTTLKWMMCGKGHKNDTIQLIMMKGKEKESTKLLERNEKTGHKRHPQQTLNPAYIRKKWDSQNYAAFGFGARIPPYFRKSQQFCLNLETDPNCQGIDGLIDAFWKANAQVQPSTTAHFAHIIYHISKLASNVRRRENQLQYPYFVLAIISKGKINDIRETVQATIFASKAPLSIIFIATEDDCEEMERLGLSGGRISYQNRRAERDMLQFVALTKFRSKLPEDANFWELLTERALRRVPWQMINWLTKNGHIPQDFKHYGRLSKQDSSGPSKLESKHRSKRINAIESFSDPSIDDLDEAEYASTSDYRNSFTSKNA
uniref:Copine domain-containing protein n=1 Tax=Loa loa TaxID=7209 RepID=A0A1I7W0S7_LOALO